MNLIILPEAQRDVTQARDWYESQKLGLGGEFLTCMEEALKDTCEFPESRNIKYRMMRQARMRRFPYIIYYRVGVGIEVWAVLHASRHSRTWKRRLQK